MNPDPKIVNAIARELDDIGIEAFAELPFMSTKESFKAWNAINTAIEKAYDVGSRVGIYIAVKTRGSKRHVRKQ